VRRASPPSPFAAPAGVRRSSDALPLTCTKLARRDVRDRGRFLTLRAFREEIAGNRIGWARVDARFKNLAAMRNFPQCEMLARPTASIPGGNGGSNPLAGPTVGRES
jgi:hypothetical protein